jgi:hypothetical protein
MADVFVDLIPLILAATLAPVFPIIVLLLLQSERGLGKAIAFVVAAVTVRLVQGVIFGLVFRSAVEAESAAGLQLIAPTLLTVVGILLLVAGVKKVRKEDDGEDSEPKWMSRLSDLNVLKAASGGALLMLVAVKQWVFTLSALAVIEEAQPGLTAGVALYLIFVAATQALVLPADHRLCPGAGEIRQTADGGAGLATASQPRDHDRGVICLRRVVPV